FFMVVPPRLFAGILFQKETQKSIIALRDQLAELSEVDVAAGDNRDDRPFASFPTQRRSHWQSAGTLSNDTCFFSQPSHRIFCVLESDNDVAVHDRFHSFPHAREHALTAGAINK